MTEITRIVKQIEAGEHVAASSLLPLVYSELRKLAVVWVSREKASESLQPSDLVHEAYLRIVGDDDKHRRWSNQAHFFSAAAQAMRRILIERARRKRRITHNSGMEWNYFENVEVDGFSEKIDLLALDEALIKFEAKYPFKAKIVQLRFFTGLTHHEISKVLEVSIITVKRHWRFARVWLHRQMQAEEKDID